MTTTADGVSAKLVQPAIYRGVIAPTNPQQGDLWVNTAVNPPILNIAGSDQTFSPTSISYTFEYLNKNIRSWDAVFSWTGLELTSITYTNGSISVVKTFFYTSGTLSSITLLFNGTTLTKTLGYSSGKIVSITYS